MSVDIHPAGHRHDTATSPTGPKTGPVARIIAGSLAAGVVAALVLSLVVFAGGTESVITGSVLIGFAFGWALIAELTSRYTTRPQRWASVPAGFMGATGVALVVFAPGYDVMTWLSWVWPPVVAAMAVWMFVQVRRSITGAGRWMLLPVVAVLGLASDRRHLREHRRTQRPGHLPRPGQELAVNGHRMHLDCHGHGGPTVVLFNGMGETSAHWARIADPIEQSTRVCAYDRPGQGWSEETTHPQDGVAAAKDLHTLLATAGETGPFVLVGHSTGGTYAMTYAHRVPRSGRRDGAPGQLQPLPAHQDRRLPRPVRRHAPRPRAAAHPGPSRCGPAGSRP